MSISGGGGKDGNELIGGGGDSGREGGKDSNELIGGGGGGGEGAEDGNEIFGEGGSDGNPSALKSGSGPIDDLAGLIAERRLPIDGG